MTTFKSVAATLPVTDVARAREFYEGTLGFTVVFEDPGGIMYSVGESMVLVYPSEFGGSNRATAATLEVDDVEAAVADLRSRGVTFEEYDLPDLKTVNGIAETGGFKGAWFKDPDGNILALGTRPQ
jgi:catechol 2,3-dioxygenase-like lactoylglutathione lyase family enzyme